MTALRIKSDVMINDKNPLDLAELVIMDRDWVFDRPDDGELIAEVNGSMCIYRIWFTWQEDSGGLTLSCAFESKLPKQSLAQVHTLLALVNEKLWLGHFDICSETSQITFRHSLLLRDGANTTAEHLQELLDYAIEQCDCFYPAFQAVVWGGKSPTEAVAYSLFETVAEA